MAIFRCYVSSPEGTREAGKSSFSLFRLQQEDIALNSLLSAYEKGVTKGGAWAIGGKEKHGLLTLW